MNNLVFKSHNEKNQLKKEVGKNDFNLKILLLQKIAKKYRINFPIVNKVTINYDTIDFVIGNNNSGPKWQIMVSFFLNMDLDYPIIAKVNQSNCYDYYDFFNDEYGADVILRKKIYKLPNFSNKIEKIINSSNNINEVNNYKKPKRNQRYNFYLNEKNYSINLTLPDTLAFSENDFIKNILNNCEHRNNIEDIYLLIKYSLNVNDFYIFIRDEDKNEVLEIDNGTVLTYTKHVANSEQEYLLDYYNNNLRITYDVKNPENHAEIKKIKELVKGEKVWQQPRKKN